LRFFSTSSETFGPRPLVRHPLFFGLEDFSSGVSSRSTWPRISRTRSPKKGVFSDFFFKLVIAPASGYSCPETSYLLPLLVSPSPHVCAFLPQFLGLLTGGYSGKHCRTPFPYSHVLFPPLALSLLKFNIPEEILLPVLRATYNILTTRVPFPIFSVFFLLPLSPMKRLLSEIGSLSSAIDQKF